MGHFGLFESPVCCKISKKMKDPLETIKHFRKKTKNENFEKVSQCRKIQKGRPLGFLRLQFAAKYQKN